jgi:23S rRNA (pseudouridine1915-N3)-methyltransferase
MSMRLFIGAVGRMKNGPENALFKEYFDRCNKAGPKIGLGPMQLAEIIESKNPRKPERQRLETQGLTKMPLKNSRIIVLDERGRNLSSVAFSDQLENWRDDGVPQTSFLVGGPDGLDPSIVNDADLVLSFGTMTWPHMIARILLVEQLYRSISLLSGHPYHRA